jgi:protocatechuate 3,4-dioxygenase, beta subunit
MIDIDSSRRDFIKQAIVTAAAFPLLLSCRSQALAGDDTASILARLKKNAQPRGAEAMGAIDVPDSVSWRTAFPLAADDGEPMIIYGTVFKADGRTPAPNTLIYFYHTDKYGIYGREGQPKHGRFRGWMLTDAKGRYEFSSIRPASYPNSTQSQHVHMTITTVDSREDWIDSILFEGDRLITARERGWSGKRGGFNPIVTLEKGKDGISRATRNIQLMA